MDVMDTLRDSNQLSYKALGNFIVKIKLRLEFEN